MGCHAPHRSIAFTDRLAVEAVSRRIQALTEYLSLYRAGASGRVRQARRLRELRYDIQRLEAWAWYLDAACRRPWWWHGLRLLGRALSAGKTGRVGQRRHPPHPRHPRRNMQRLSTFSIIDRAYAALLEAFQGGLLTLGLRCREGDAACRARLNEKVDAMNGLRSRLAEEAGYVVVVCMALWLVQRCSHWVGLHPGAVRTRDS